MSQAPRDPSVLLVEDDQRLAQLVERGLRRAGYEVRAAHSGQDALDAAHDADIDVIVLDIGIPAPDGLTVLRTLRAEGDTRPVLMLTGRRDVPDRVVGLEAGADDYLPKPFALDELVARVGVLTRRSTQPERRVLKSADVLLDPVARTVERDGVTLELTPREFDLLEFFLRNPNQALSHATIRDRVWPEEDGADSNVVAVYVSYLRAKVDRPFERSSLQTVRGTGYRWNPER